MCSTPFGITAVGTDTSWNGISHRRRAQRLSASLRSARVETRSSMPVHVGCSTPFGITAVGTIPRTYSGVTFGYSAQRLSASLRSAPCSCALGFASVRGAQRLSASLRSSLAPGANGGRIAYACSTPFGITAVGTCPCGTVGHVLGHPCSTPFGITEVGTCVDVRRPGMPDAVLNAFRHHCGRHTQLRASMLGRRRCAQRLSASLRSAPVVQARCASRERGAQRLSASLRSARRLPARRRARSASAQRLSASLRSSPSRSVSRRAYRQ